MKRKRAQQQAAAQYQNVVAINSQRSKRNIVQPKNRSQEIYVDTLNDDLKSIVFAIGPAGTGKTLLGVQWAIDEYKFNELDKIVITRPAVSVDEQHGFLPGDLNEKMAPWTRPIFDVFEQNYSKMEVERQIKDGVLEIAPLAYMRGRTFKNTVVIADEMQNATPSQMKMLLTRLGEGCKMIVTGDLQQADRPSKNGLLEFLNLYNEFDKSKYVSVCKFDRADIERHEAVKEILEIYGEED